MNRRTKAVSSFLEESKPKFEMLHKLWEEIGLSEAESNNRFLSCLKSIQEVIDNSLTADENMKLSLESNIHNLTEEIETLSRSLMIKKPSSPSSMLSLAAKETILSAQVEVLKQEKQSRLQQWNNLRAEESCLCLKLKVQQLPSIAAEIVPTLAEIREIRIHVDELSDELTKRWQKFAETVEIMKKLIERKECVPCSEFEIQCLDCKVENFVFSTENWDELQLLNNKVSELYKQFLENLQQKISVLHAELISWQDKCKKTVEQFNGEQFSEEHLDWYSAKIATLTVHYTKHSEVLEKIIEWELAFRKKIEFENREKDSARYFQLKGGKLEQQLREANAVKKRFAQLDKEIEQNRDSTAWICVKVNGLTPFEHTTSLKQQHADAVQREKENKLLKESQRANASSGKPPAPRQKRLNANAAAETLSRANKFRKLNARSSASKQTAAQPYFGMVASGLMQRSPGQENRSKTPGIGCTSTPAINESTLNNSLATSVGTTFHTATTTNDSRVLVDNSNARFISGTATSASANVDREIIESYAAFTRKLHAKRNAADEASSSTFLQL